MIKNIGKLKQWTGEKIGKAQRTRMDEDFETLQTETEAKRVALEKLSEVSHAYLKAISKRVEGDDKYKGLAIETFGISMSTQAHALREDSTYREALLQMGEAHQNIGLAQSELISRFGSTYIECLEREQAQMKEYQTLQKKLQSRRLDYDAKLAKVQKAKKEKPEWEEEMQAAKAKYEETRECILGVMTAINDAQDENVHSLKMYYEAQLAFARKTVEILEAILESAFATPSGPRTKHTAGQSLRSFRQSSIDPDEEHSGHSDDHSSVHSVTTGRRLDQSRSISDLRRHPGNQRNAPELGRSASHLTLNTKTAHSRNGSTGSSRASGFCALSASPTLLPQVRPQKQVRALYNFEATGEGELSFQKGDIVRIIEEIDEGWWEGEMVDASGMRHEGMFPSNYVEEVFSDTESGRQRQGSLNSATSNSGQYADEEEAAYYERASEPTGYPDEPEYAVPEPEPEVSIHASAVRRAPPPPVRNPQVLPVAQNGLTAPANLAIASVRATPPLIRPSSGVAPLSKPIGSRAPPPPPGARRTGGDSLRQSVVFNHTTAPIAGVSPPAAPSTPGMGYIPKDYFVSKAADVADTEVGPCRECQCTEFSPNVFKRGSCNNCFHAH
ncbi:hypothetical protein BC939DRAFT_532335 [Gamsiella multidivaricata]|uniref:uncharacterized protein n=1 Tax=Gamsiella multidivaricata TaxID=101098 RepID=UPI00221EA8FE|nr:uncharacterized protein BC939DRAFT_532335 [Gamsiella multidivaricata]KAG0367837.1 hypothetical protein BGZ54_003172 [Gamsiella multidivaricata]KAI7817960.1 hypothetical protein BC939DRAFT_532335 [Gamsiella multidivaricata]